MKKNVNQTLNVTRQKRKFSAKRKFTAKRKFSAKRVQRNQHKSIWSLLQQNYA